MKKMTLFLAAALAAATTASFAQPTDNDAGGPPPNGHHRRPPPLPLIVALDANHDHVIDAAEIANASAALLTLDKNGDGQLTVDEYMPPHPGATNGAVHPRRPLPPIVKALDANGDGVIDASEIANASAALKTLDKNNDGQLTFDEIMPPRPPGPPPGGGDDNMPPGGPDGQRPPPDDNGGADPGPPAQQ
ncbi:MAG TPA: hypothetical protein VHB20_03535 [Verrucomicrobiae bacterium]|jgi:hypothetical protein|nr:hypothetical protein [Verrucomicrobiae bacterium]